MFASERSLNQRIVRPGEEWIVLLIIGLLDIQGVAGVGDTIDHGNE